jgi:hypothetical protein
VCLFSDAASPAPPLLSPSEATSSEALRVSLRSTTYTPVRVTVVPTKDSCAEKQPQLEARIERTFAMKRLLERGLRCDCLSLGDCALIRDEDPTPAREKVAPRQHGCSYLKEHPAGEHKRAGHPFEDHLESAFRLSCYSGVRYTSGPSMMYREDLAPRCGAADPIRSDGAKGVTWMRTTHNCIRQARPVR